MPNHRPIVPARHILIPIHDFSAGGTELIAYRLARHWLADGRRVTLLAGAEDGPLRDKAPEGTDIHILSPQRPRSTFSRLSLGKHLAPAARALAPDLIFIPGNFHFIVGYAMKAALPSTPIVAKISNPLLTPPTDAAALQPLARPLLRALTRGIDWFAAMSHGLAQEARHQLAHDRVSALYDPNIADDAAIHARPDRSLRRDEPLRLLAIGRLEAQKDFPRALETVAVLRQRRPVTLRICGEGPLRSEIEQRIEALGLRDCVTLVGFTTALAEEYRRADLLLITSRYEGGPAVAVEALVEGLPVISTDCSHFLRDLISDPSLGTLVGASSAEALASAIEAQMTRAHPTAALIASVVQPVRAGAAAQAYLDLFDKLQDGHGFVP